MVMRRSPSLDKLQHCVYNRDDKDGDYSMLYSAVQRERNVFMIDAPAVFVVAR